MTWFLTVFSARNIRSPICRLVSPSAISDRIFFSCGVSDANSAGPAAWPLRIRSITRTATDGSISEWPWTTARMPLSRVVPSICLRT